MNEKELNRLRGLDWEDVSARLMQAATVFAVRYGWGVASCLPGGKSLEDVVLEAIADIWSDPGRLNPSTDVLVQLRGIVRSKLWNLSQSRDDDVARSDDLSESVPVTANGSESVDTRDEFQRAIELLQASPKVKGNEEMELVVLAMSCGFMDIDELVRETGIPVERMYQLRRELRAIYSTIAVQLHSTKERQS